MKNWIKSYWSNCLSITAIICSVIALVRCEPITFTDSYLTWVIGISVALISIGVVIILGYQIYNSVTLDKKMNEMFDKKTEDVRENLAASNARAIAAVLYQAEGVNLKLNVALKDYESAIRTLRARLEYAISLNQKDRLSEIAGLIVNTRTVIIRNNGICDNSLDNSFLKLAQCVLNHLSASDEQVPRLYKMMGEIQDDLHDHHSTSK